MMSKDKTRQEAVKDICRIERSIERLLADMHVGIDVMEADMNRELDWVRERYDKRLAVLRADYGIAVIKRGIKAEKLRLYVAKLDRDIYAFEEECDG